MDRSGLNLDFLTIKLKNTALFGLRSYSPLSFIFTNDEFNALNKLRKSSGKICTLMDRMAFPYNISTLDLALFVFFLMYLDPFLPRVAELAINSSDRQTKVSNLIQHLQLILEYHYINYFFVFKR